MKIVYGVSGEGSGHSSRARVIATHLIANGHDVKLVSYDRGYQNLKDDFDVSETEGLRIASHDNKVSVVETFTNNIRRLPEGHKKLQLIRNQLFREFKPDCVITDFEPMTAYLANHYDLPLISIDNQHRMRYLEYDCPKELVVESKVTKAVIRAMVPKPDVSLVTTFFKGKTKNDRTFLFPPILRQAVIEKRPTTGVHVLVYLTSGFESLLDELKKFPRELFYVYGYDRSDHQGSIQFKPFSKDGFLEDLASCQAVIATAGFTLLSEALYLKKPYLALPMQGQFEQQLNGYQLAQLGYGKSVDEITEEAIGDFLYRLVDYRETLLSYESQGNAEITSKLDELLSDDGKLIRAFHSQRRS